MKKLMVFAMGLVAFFEVQASPIFFDTPAVISVDRMATFDSLLTTGTDLSNYSEDGLYVTGNGEFFANRSAYHYVGGGNNEYVSIRGTDNVVLTAVDFELWNGWSQPLVDVRWETYLGGMLTGSGHEHDVANETVIGWIDSAGFDELRVAAAPGIFVSEPGFGNAQGIALDDVRAQVIPEPATFAFVGIFGFGLWFVRRYFPSV